MAGQIGEAFDSEIQGGGSFPFSFPSQPPDIKNWFSSYEYEPPNSSDFPDITGNFELHEDSERETQNSLGSLTAGKDECAFEDENEDSTQSLQSVPETVFSADDDIELNWELRTERKHQVNERSSNVTEVRSNGVKSDVPDDMPQNNQSCTKYTNAKLRDGASSHGFISTKKRKNPTTSFKNMLTNTSGERESGPLKHNVENDDGALGGKEQSGVGIARVLVDRTNIQVAPEASGKWRCPRKSKPHFEPPLKQLRLEKWMRRMP